MKMRFLLSVVFLSLCFSDSLLGDPLTVTGVGKYTFASSYGLSGLTYQSGNSWFAVDDSGGLMFPLAITLNNTTGEVSSASPGTSVSLNGRTDVEGVAYNPANNTVYVSDETGPAIAQYNLSGGNAISSVSVPLVYNNIRSNYSLESLALQRGGENALWTANEEALTVDGSLSTTTSGTWVRIQKFNSNLQPAGQWAYKTDSITGLFPYPYEAYNGSIRSGVSDLCILPNGKLLVLERELGFNSLSPTLPFRNRIYLADFTNATDISGLSGLAGNAFTDVTKQLLWEGTFGTSNFEGLALGPALSNGYNSLLMISDGDSGLDSSLYALRIGGEIPEPLTGTLLLFGIFLTRASFLRKIKR